MNVQVEPAVFVVPLSEVDSHTLQRQLIRWHPESQTALFLAEILRLRSENNALRHAVGLSVRYPFACQEEV